MIPCTSKTFVMSLCCSLFFFSAKAQSQGQTRWMPPDTVLKGGAPTESQERLSGLTDRITEQDMNKTPMTNPIEAISGRVAGLAVQKGDNARASLQAVRLRGTTSLITGNDPLIIVDGVFGDLQMLNSVYPSDIESFTILKDASETAQYGSRGASGVIQITTKKGVGSKMHVSYSGSCGMTFAYKRLGMLTADRYRETVNALGIAALDKGFDTDFQKEIEQVGFRQNHHVAFNGGSTGSNYRIALGYIDREGVIKGERLKNFFSNMNMSQKVFGDKVITYLGMFASIRNNSVIPDEQKLFYSAASFNPTFPNHRNPNTGSWEQTTTANQITHPLAWIEVNDDESNSHISTHALLEFAPDNRFTVKMFGSYSHNVIEHGQFFPTYVWAHGQAYRSTRRSEALVGNITCNYKESVGKHSVNLLALAELQRETESGYEVTVTDFNTNDFGYHNLQGGATRLWEGTTSFYDRPSLASFMGKMDYAFDHRYSITATIRADGSSKFGARHQWGVFPSVSVAWMVGKEAFMRNFSVVNDLKLRAGYGLAGNQSGISSYATRNMLSPDGVAPIGDLSSVTLSTMKNINPDLKWEVKRTFDAGVDIALFENRLYFSAGYYRSTILDMLYLYHVAVPPFIHHTLLANIGSMRNSGTEISLGVIPLRTAESQLSVNLNATFQQNKLLSLSGYYNGEIISAPKYRSIASLNGAGFHGGYNHVVYQVVGQPLGVFYLPKSTGLVPDGKGGYTYGVADLNGGGVSLEDGEDRYIAGQAMPKLLIGSNVGFRFRRCDLSIQLNGAFGHKIYNGTALTYMNMNTFPDYNVMNEAPSRSIKDQTATDYWLERGDYLNVDYIAFGWNVPLTGTYVSSLRLSVMVDNVFTFTGYSGLTPMINHSAVSPTLGLDDKRGYPPARTFSVGFNVTF